MKKRERGKEEGQRQGKRNRKGSGEAQVGG